jgi:hypothetical protein
MGEFNEDGYSSDRDSNSRRKAGLMTKHFMGRGVFIALRPNIFGHDDEHVTLEYLGHDPSIWQMREAIKKWHNQFAGLPVTVAVNGYANWSAKDDYHNVALIEFREYPDISYIKNWHITLESSRNPLRPYQFDRDEDAFRYDYCDRLWIGYKDAVTKEKKWIEPHNAKHLVKAMEEADA